jgi:hypothetical protein
MNGIYKINLDGFVDGPVCWNHRTRAYVPSNERDLQRAWHVFVATCESLNRDGLDYDVQFNLACAHPYIVIKASGVSNRVYKPATTRTCTTPLTHEQCKKRLDAVERFTTGRMRAYGRESSKYNELSNIAEWGPDFIEAELDFWREMEALSGQRQHNKPGMTDETIYADDEVLAA